jgi:hypothetical protein
MRFLSVLTIKRVVLGSLCIGALVLSTGATPVSAASEGGRRLHITKECSEYNGAAGEWCTITASNISRLPVGTKVLYSQAAGVPAGLLDSNVVLDAGDGNRAVGRCTLDLETGLGLCTFSDGTGRLAGFEARVDVTCPGGPDCDWNGTYSVNRGRD